MPGSLCRQQICYLGTRVHDTLVRGRHGPVVPIEIAGDNLNRSCHPNTKVPIEKISEVGYQHFNKKLLSMSKETIFLTVFNYLE